MEDEEEDGIQPRGKLSQQQELGVVLWRLRQIENEALKRLERMISDIRRELERLFGEVRKEAEEDKKDTQAWVEKRIAEFGEEIKWLRRLLISAVITFAGALFASLLTLLNSKGLL